MPFTPPKDDEILSEYRRYLSELKHAEVGSFAKRDTIKVSIFPRLGRGGIVRGKWKKIENANPRRKNEIWVTRTG